MDILICNLDATATSHSLRGLFSEFAVVKSALIVVDDIIRNKRLGWVVISNHTDAENAVIGLDNVKFRQRMIGVKSATLQALHK